jgi:hypothetical protein
MSSEQDKRKTMAVIVTVALGLFLGLLIKKVTIGLLIGLALGLLTAGFIGKR